MNPCQIHVLRSMRMICWSHAGGSCMTSLSSRQYHAFMLTMGAMLLLERLFIQQKKRLLTTQGSIQEWLQVI